MRKVDVAAMQVELLVRSQGDAVLCAENSSSWVWLAKDRCPAAGMTRSAQM